MYEVMSGHQFGFTTDMDGHGTHALRIDWSGYNGTCADQAATLLTYLPKPYPKHVMFSWKMQMGRTATGGGIGPINSFAIANPNCGNAARKVFLVLRDQPDMGGTDRIDYIWPGPSPVGVQFTASDRGLAIASRAFLPEQHIGEVITNTVELQAESSPGAHDGVMRLWVNGNLVLNVTNAAIGAEAFERFQFPTVMNSPLHDQSEYLWDIVAWAPQG